MLFNGLLKKTNFKSDINNKNGFDAVKQVSKTTFLLLAFRLLVFLCIFYLFEISINSILTTNAINKPVWLFISISIIIFCCSILLLRVRNYKIYIIFIFFVALILRLIFINLWKIEPISDFKSYLDLAKILSEQSLNNWHVILPTTKTVYQNIWSAHMPFVLYETFVLKLFGSNTGSLLAMNAISGSLTCVFSMLISKKMFGKKAGVITGIILAINPTILFFTPVFSNQHIATLFFIMSLFFFLNKPFKSIYLNIVISSLLLAISNLLRPEMQVVIIAIICLYIYILLSNLKEYKDRIFRFSLSIGLKLLTFIFIFNLIILLVNSILINTKIINQSITKNNFLYKIAVGLNQQSEGRWNLQDSKFVDNEVELIRLIKERTSNIKQLGALIIKKQIYQFGTYNYSWSIAGKENYITKHIYYYITQNYMLLILLLAFIGCYFLLKRKKHNIFYILIILIGFFITYSIIEVQDRYNFILIPLISILASLACKYNIIMFKKMMFVYKKNGLSGLFHVKRKMKNGKVLYY